MAGCFIAVKDLSQSKQFAPRIVRNHLCKKELCGVTAGSYLILAISVLGPRNHVLEQEPSTNNATDGTVAAKSKLV
jgi:hypothetical protein